MGSLVESSRGPLLTIKYYIKVHSQRGFKYKYINIVRGIVRYGQIWAWAMCSLRWVGRIIKILLWMSSSRAVTAFGCLCQCRNSPGLNHSILRYCEFWGAADDAELNTVKYIKKSTTKSQIKACFVFTVFSREIETISRGPTFGDFVTILTEGSMQNNTVAGLQSTRVLRTYSPLHPLVNVMYCVRVSLRTVKIFLAQH